VLLHEFAEDLVFALEFGLELLDLFVLGVLAGLGLAAVVEGGVPVLEELLLPAVEEVGRDAEFIAEIGDGHLVEEVAFEGGDLLRSGKVTALPGHDETSVQVRLTRTEQFSRFG
jgi:hypothetical protein